MYMYHNLGTPTGPRVLRVARGHVPVVNTEARSCECKWEYYGAQAQWDLQPVDLVLQVLHWMPTHSSIANCKNAVAMVKVALT